MTRDRRILLAVFWVFLLAAPLSAEQNGGYFLIRNGTIPLVISIPHGGSTRIPGIPRRQNGTILRDSRTLELATRIAGILEKNGTGRPWIVGARFRRWYADPNRKPGRKAWEHPGGKKLYLAYHRALKRSIIKAARQGKPVLLIDLHGQSSKPDDIYLGTAYNRSVSSWCRRFGWNPAYGANSKNPGIKALRELLVAAGLSVPRRDARGFSGGYITRHYMLRPDTAAVQIEVQRRWRLNLKNREQMARFLARALGKIMAGRNSQE